MHYKIKLIIFCFILLFMLTSCSESTQVAEMGIRLSEVDGCFVFVSAGHGTTFGILCDGSLWWWGRDLTRTYGFSTRLYRDENGMFYGANAVEFDLDVVYVTSTGVSGNSQASSFALAITSEGTLWGWGRNAFGQLGDGSRQIRGTPIQIMENVISVSAIGDSAFAVTSDGALWAWGLDFLGLIDENIEVFTEPVHIMSDVFKVSSNSWHVLVLKTDGSLWGLGLTSLLGIGAAHKDGVPTAYIPITLEPVLVLSNVRYASAGGFHSLAICNDDYLWFWGNSRTGYYGELGWTLTKNINILYPMIIKEQVQKVDSGFVYFAAVTFDNTLYVWRILGPGTAINKNLIYKNRIAFPKVKIKDDVSFVSISSSNNPFHTHFVMIKTDGSLVSFGNNIFGQLGTDQPFDGDFFETVRVHVPSQTCCNGQ